MFRDYCIFVEISIHKKEREDIIMTAMELELKKSKLQKAISMLDSEEDVNRVEKYLHRMVRREQPPCQYTIEELKKHLEEAEEDFRMGRYYTSDELRKRHPLCK